MIDPETSRAPQDRRDTIVLPVPPTLPGEAEVKFEKTEPPELPSGSITVQWGPEDDVRRGVMYITLTIFALTVSIACITGLWSDKPNAERVLARTNAEDRKLARELEEAPFDHLKQILQILLPAETALLGSAMGFYFGAKSR